MFEQAAALGRRNQEIIELARRHCSHMQFPEWELGGRGMAEAATGLPINSRRVHCAHAAPSNSASANLEWIAADFYNANCVGCPNRLPTGEVPTLATVLEAREVEQARVAEQEQHRLTALRSAWSARAERRRVLRAQAHPPMQGALADVDILDADPWQPADAQVIEAAIQRLVALAERAPDTYSTEVVEHLAEVADKALQLTLLSPLRRIAGAMPAFRSRVMDVATSSLRRGPAVEAARCLVDLSAALDSQALDERVVHSLVLLAGQPDRDDLGHRTVRSATNEPAGLRLVADRKPEAVRDAIRRLLRRRRPASSDLVLPPGLEPDCPIEPPSDLDRCVAAGAVRSLAASHTDLALTLAGDMALNLADDDDPYDLHAVADVQHSLAVLLVLRGVEVAALLERTGEYASPDHRERLFGVLERTHRLVDPSYRWRELSDPVVGDADRRSIGKLLMTTALSRVGGTWGEEVAHQAAILIDALTSDALGGGAEGVPAILGALLVTIDRLDRVPSGLVVTLDDSPPQLRMLEAASRRMAVSGTAQLLTHALSNLAAADAVGTVRAIGEVLQSEGTSERDVELAWRVLPSLGEIGATQGARAGVLRSILPILHTYLVHTHPAVRGAAIDAWSTIASRHPTPSSLRDLLPALVHDPYVAVIRSLLKAAMRLKWNEEDLHQLLLHAWSVASGIPPSDKDTLKMALRAVRVLGATHRPRAEALILKRADDLDGYELRDTLRGDWLRESRVSPSMASLRLKLAGDPRINDRVNSRDDEELRALLECGAGLRHLPETDVRAAALQWSPQFPYWTAEFAEVLWRAGRPGDAAAVVGAALNATPAERVYESRRALLGCFLAAVRLDAELLSGLDAAKEVRDASDSAVEALRSCSPEERPADLARDVGDRIVLRCLLLGSDTPLSLAELAPTLAPGCWRTAEDSAAGLRNRAAFLAELRTRLGVGARRQTATGAYVRGIASLCGVADQLLQFDAAELDASESRNAHLNAAKRRAVSAVAALLKCLGDDDPIGAPLLSALQEAETITAGSEVAPLLAKWALLPVPLLFVSGPREAGAAGERVASASREPERTVPPSVAVALAYIDNRLVTGPQVLRPGTAYTLRIDVRMGAWPDWADRLDAEFLSHLNTAEAHTPSFAWRRSDLANGSVIGEGTLILRFGLSAGQPAPPFLLSLRFRGQDKNGQRQELCDVAGHRELRLRPFDASRDGLTGYRVVDERLLSLYERLHGAGYDEDQVQAFCRLLTAVCRAGLSMTWEKRYKRGQRVRERDFHDDLHERLLKDPELGGRVERNEPLALGYLDVRHDGIIAELKVERQVAVTQERAPKYMGQPTQYAASDGARLSILCILDMSPKREPVGTPENYLWQIEPALHGLTNPEAPSLVTAVVINCSLPAPSSWSRGHPGKHRTIQ